MARFREHRGIGDSSRVDRDNGIIRGVKLLGRQSKNGRRYSEAAVTDGRSLYDGSKVYINHFKTEDGPNDRDWHDWAAVVESPVIREGELYGDLRCRQQHPCYEMILEAAEKFAGNFGLSHVADGEGRLDGDVELVESITRVHSVDIVTDPATTAGLFESVIEKPPKPEPKAMPKTTIRKIKESTSSGVKLHKLLREMIEDGAAPPEMEVEVAETASPEQQVKSALMTAVLAKLETASEDQLKKVMAALEMSDSIAAEATGGGSAGGESGGTGGDDAVAESVKKLERRTLIAESRAQLAEAGIRPTDAQVKALANADESDRQALIESWQGGGYGDRPASSPGILTESGGAAPGSYTDRFWKDPASAK